MNRKTKAVSLALAMMFIVTLFASCGNSSTAAKTTTAASSKQVKVINIDLTSEEYAFGVDKDQADLLTQVNDYIAQIKKDGTFDKISDHYFGNGTPVGVTSAKLDSSKDQLVVATNAAFEPFEYTKGDKYYGIDMEIAAGLAKKLGKELVIQNMDFDSVCLSVSQHKCDIAMAGLTVKAEREKYVTFSDTYYKASQRVIAMKNCKTFSSCKTAADVEKILRSMKSDTKIGVQNGTTGQLYCKGDKEMGFTALKVTCKGYKNGSLAVQDMINGNIDYVIIDAAPAACIVKSINSLS